MIGVSIFDRENSTFRFHPGPIFSQIILADEINRASPKAQSALLEAMEEHQVTAEGETRPLPEPFFVIATQNPLHQVGTFPLPGIAARPVPHAPAASATPTRRPSASS